MIQKPETKIFFIKSGLLVSLIFLVATNAFSQAVPGTPPQAETFWLWNFLGRLHPLAVHFPVGLIIFAAILELFTLKNFYSSLRPGIYLLVLVGILTAAISAVFGWLLSSSGDYGLDTLSIHQWTGIATICLGAIALFILYKIRKRNQLQLIRPYRALLFFTAVSVSVAGHFGASLTHGNDYLSSALPWSKDYEEPTVSNLNFASLKSDTGKLTLQQEKSLNVKVRAIFAHNCYKCHGSEKVKGELRLDGRDMVFKGGKSGLAIQPGNLVESEVYRRITLPRDHKEAMPSKGKKLKDEDIAVLKFWIEKGAPWPQGDKDDNIFHVAKLEPRNPLLPPAFDDNLNPVDLWTNEYFSKNKIKWTAPVDDRIYLRRIYLDIIGLLPAPEELEVFINDPRPDKRSVWVRQLLNRNDDYAMHWLTFWNDALRNDYTGTGYITGGRFNITDWLYKSLKSNKSYDQFVKELIDPVEESKGFIEGIKWRGVVNASQRTEMQAAQNVAQVFLGLNIKCASCHNSFVNNWKLQDAYAFANIFADTSLEINRCDKPTGKYTTARMLYKELGTIDNNAQVKQKRKQLAEITVKPENGRLYRTIVNRVWAQLMGRGIVEPVDVMDNIPWSQDLLDWLAYNFVQEKFDIKELIWLITTSHTYQLPSVGLKQPNNIVDQEFHFNGMARRRMSAEQFSDAVTTIIGPVFPDSLVKYKPFKKLKDKSNPYAYEARASLVMNNSFLTALGRPNRETVTTGRESQANLLQALELTNGERFNQVLKTGADKWKLKYRDPDLIIKELYRKALGREPQSSEYTVAKQLLGNNPDTESIQDLFWAILLLPEFQIIY